MSSILSRITSRGRVPSTFTSSASSSSLSATHSKSTGPLSVTSLPLTVATSTSSSSECPPHEPMDQTTLDQVAEMMIIDSRGNQIPFGSIYEYQKTIVVFIRHFFCGMCHSYVSALAKVPTSVLDAAGTKIVVIGCGAWDMIPTYQGTTGFKGLVYSDPTNRIHDALGLVRDLVVPPKDERTVRSYVPRKYGQAVRRGIVEGLKQPVNAVTGRYGNISQLGGDFILGPGNVCDYAHRMRNTMDHMEIHDLMTIADVKLPDPPLAPSSNSSRLNLSLSSVSIRRRLRSPSHVPSPSESSTQPFLLRSNSRVDGATRPASMILRTSTSENDLGVGGILEEDWTWGRSQLQAPASAGACDDGSCGLPPPSPQRSFSGGLAGEPKRRMTNPFGSGHRPATSSGTSSMTLGVNPSPASLTVKTSNLSLGSTASVPARRPATSTGHGSGLSTSPSALLAPTMASPHKIRRSSTATASSSRPSAITPVTPLPTRPGGNSTPTTPTSPTTPFTSPPTSPASAVDRKIVSNAELLLTSAESEAIVRGRFRQMSLSSDTTPMSGAARSPVSERHQFF